MSKCLDPFRFLLISLAGWMNQQWPTSPARSSRVVVTAATLVSVMNGWRAGGSHWAFLLLVGVCLTQQSAIAQDPWSGAATRMATAFTGPIVRGFSLVAIVVGGLTLAFSDGGGKRTLGGLIFGLGMALGATQFMAWLFA